MRFHLIALALFYSLFSNAVLAQEDFTAWLDGLKQEAIEAGVSDETVTATINHIELIPGSIKLDLAQPEFISPFFDYYHKRVDALKIARGRELLGQYESLLNQIEVQYGVPEELLVAFWGMETNYGGYQGNVDTLSTLATLAYNGRRAKFFRSQLLDAMRVIDAGHASVGQLRGSWAGAFGNMQFMPTTFITYAVDGDGDDHIDIVNSVPDAFASAANYLSQVGWRKDELAMIEVQLPENFAWQNAQLNLRKSTEDWARMGVKALRESDDTTRAVKLARAPVVIKPIVNKKAAAKKIKPGLQTKVASKNMAAIRSYSSPPPSTFNQGVVSQNTVNQSNINQGAAIQNTTLPNVSGQAAIILPQGWRGPAFMVFENFDAIMDWNRSVNYALSVAQLAKRINQESRILGGQLAEAGALTFQQMFELQNALNERGFDAGEPDGFPGLRTQSAIRAYQLSQRLPADGYASPSVLDSLKASIKLTQQPSVAVE